MEREWAEETGSFVVCNMRKPKYGLVVPAPGEVLAKLTEDKCSFV